MMLPPESLLGSISKQFPTFWKEADACRAKRSRSWPDWCFLPRDELAAILEPRFPKKVNVVKRDKQLAFLKRTTILTPWRVCRNVYRFDPDIYDALINTSIGGKLPVDLLMELPEWTVYIETPGRDTYYGSKSEGFVASLNFSSKDEGEIMLSFLSFLDHGHYFTEWFFLKEGHTIEEAMAEALELYYKSIANRKVRRLEKKLDLREVSEHVSKLVNLLLYICQTNSEYRDIRCADGSDRLPANPSPKKTKKGLRYYPPKKPTVWECGFRQGEQLRRAKSEQSEFKGGTHESPIPHTRAAHWHTYIVGKGSRKDPSKGKRVLKWIHTVLVNAAKGSYRDPVAQEMGQPRFPTGIQERE
ncbi:hypothetical protein ACFL2Q_18525 [Thermodesulfobacteriota bacterium]